MSSESSKRQDEPLLDSMISGDSTSQQDAKINLSRSLIDSFQFNESNLVSKTLNPSDLKKMILELYGFSKLSEDTLRLILKQGAEDNKLLRISEASYSKLIDALEIPLDSEEQSKTTDIIRHVA